jgi:spore coat protein U-like protein
MRFQITASAVALFTAFLLGSNAYAASCRMVVGNISFSPYNPLLSDRVINQTGAVEVSCKVDSPPLTVVISYNIDISAGLSNSFIVRTMRQGVDTLAYNIYRDSGATQVWGDVTGGFRVSGSFSNFVALNSEQRMNHIMYATISPQQLGKAVSTSGLTYSDLLQVTLSF